MKNLDQDTYGAERVFLLPGEYHITKKPKHLATLLGSCVAVCIYNEINKMAAMNHFVRDRSSKADDDIGRFGDLSIRYLIEQMFKVDGQKTHYKAKIFGGGAVVGHLSLGIGIGKQNIAVAQEILLEYGIPILEKDVGGNQGRKIFFDTSAFRVESRLIGEARPVREHGHVRVLIVDDSPLVRKILSKVIEAMPDMEVVGEAADAFEARDLIISTDPDVISLDIIMPKLDGLKFLEKLMKHFPKPVVIVSTIAKNNSEIARKAQRLGAVGVIDKDSLEIYKGLDRVQREYIPMLRIASDRKTEK